MATATDVQRLRSETGAGVMDSKKALEAAKGDFEKAKAILKEKGLASAAKRGDREAKEGVVEAYVHAGGRIGALVELSSETDFVARNPEFRDNLAQVIQVQRRRRKLELELAAAAGTTMLSRLIHDKDGSLVQLAACALLFSAGGTSQLRPPSPGVWLWNFSSITLSRALYSSQHSLRRAKVSS